MNYICYAWIYVCNACLLRPKFIEVAMMRVSLSVSVTMVAAPFTVGGRTVEQ